MQVTRPSRPVQQTLQPLVVGTRRPSDQISNASCKSNRRLHRIAPVLLREVEYAKPASVADALSALAANDGARALAGGQTLINVMKARAASPDVLVDLNGLDELKGIELAGDGTLTIGAMTTYTELMASAEAKARPILGEVVATIADVQVRNRGTIGGNVCANDPTNHLPPLMAAIGARFTIAGATGEREVDASEFFLGVYLTAVGPGELLTKITIPAGKHDGFAAITLGADGTCIANAAASLNGTLRVALGCVDAVPVVVEPASADEAAVREAVRQANLDPPSDVHASAEYRAHLAEVLAVRAAKQAQEHV
jgi:aerobic carbon-monoxide dehydrogenase medium subunit